MDLHATLAQPITAIFHHVAAPPHLGNWLSDVVGVEACAAGPLGVGMVFALTMRRGERLVAATGEVVAYEPPWLVAYRLHVEACTHVVRLACTASEGATRLHVHQGGSSSALSVDLERLAESVAAAAAGL
ncbi:MAG TPA: SRPBCC family protein [Bacillota bacterium]|nr:SRPBCC family protein [Bacillota bacterium]